MGHGVDSQMTRRFMLSDFCSHFSFEHSVFTPADPGSHMPLDSMERATEPFPGYHGHGWGQCEMLKKHEIAWLSQLIYLGRYVDCIF